MSSEANFIVFLRIKLYPAIFFVLKMLFASYVCCILLNCTLGYIQNGSKQFKKVSMIRKYHTLQTNPRHLEEESQNT